MTPGQEALLAARQRMLTSRTIEETHQVAHKLALALGAYRTEEGTIKALLAVLLLLEHPEISEKDAYLKPVDTAAALASGSAPLPFLPQPWARVLPLVLGSAASPFEAALQPSNGPTKAEDLRRNPLTGTPSRGPRAPTSRSGRTACATRGSACLQTRCEGEGQRDCTKTVP